MFKKKVIITLKSGARIKLKVKEFGVTYKTASTSISGYKYDGLVGHAMLHIDVNEIAAVQVTR